ncbi:MAG: hypothetical protein JWO36_2066 [Myxococcales bacterium]|nr:hypothetical protein [Myxococcales bacterium]
MANQSSTKPPRKAKTKRDAKASRSAFRASEAKKPAAKQRASSSRVAKAESSSRGGKAKSSLRNARKVKVGSSVVATKAKVGSRLVTKKRKANSAGVATKPKSSSRSGSRAMHDPKDSSRTTVHARVHGEEHLGDITVPSGKLVVFDVGLIGYLPRPALEPALVTAQVPSDRALSVVGTRVGQGRFADCWDHVAVKLADGEIAHSKKLGEAGVDFARLVCMDHGALDHWKHEDSLDGLADFVFWGRDAAALAKAIGAPANKEGHGWRNLSVADAEAKADQAARIRAHNKWLLATDLRPHSHHFHALAAARKSKQGAGTIEVGGAKVCLFFTSWGDGVFPIYLDLDHDDRPVRVRVRLNTDASNAAMQAVNA